MLTLSLGKKTLQSFFPWGKKLCGVFFGHVGFWTVQWRFFGNYFCFLLMFLDVALCFLDIAFVCVCCFSDFVLCFLDIALFVCLFFFLISFCVFWTSHFFVCFVFWFHLFVFVCLWISLITLPALLYGGETKCRSRQKCLVERRQRRCTLLERSDDLASTLNGWCRNAGGDVLHRTNIV